MIPSEIIAKAKKRAQDHADRQVIASFVLTNITHARIGGYNSRNKSEKLKNYFEYPREQSLKGLWRWWLRALLSGTALSDDQIEQKVNENLGANNIPAKFKVRLVLADNAANGSPEPFVDKQDLEKLANPPKGRDRTNLMDEKLIPSRLQLSIMDRNLGRQQIEELLAVYHPNKLALLIEIHADDRDAKDLSLLIAYSLVLAITFSGLGSMTRRGFGKFDFQHINKCPDEIAHAIRQVKNSKTGQQLEAELSNLTQNATRAAETVFGARNEAKRLPMHPTLYSDGRTSHFTLKVVSINGNHGAKGILHLIGKATLKSEWKKMKFGQHTNKPAYKPGGDLHTWVLGLPRYNPHPGSGYASIHNGTFDYYKRRASAIFLAPHLSEGSKWHVIVLGFRSLDWPTITHIPGNRSRTRPFEINPDESNFGKYFEDAFKTVTQCLEKVSAQGIRKGGEGGTSSQMGRYTGKYQQGRWK